MKTKIMRSMSLLLVLMLMLTMLPAAGMTAFASGAPVITTQPQDAMSVCGEDAKFTVEATGENLTYQWYLLSGGAGDPIALFDGVEFLGAKTAELTVKSMETYYTRWPDVFGGEWCDVLYYGDVYYCVITNTDGEVSSEKATYRPDHNAKGDAKCDVNSHWCESTCSYKDLVHPVREPHDFENGKCKVCGASEKSPRLAGEDRVETAALIASSLYETAENVIIASGNDYADALAAVPLAHALGAPILLMRGSIGDLATAEEIDRLEAENIFIIGGTSAVSAEYEEAFIEEGYNVTRIYGANRFATAVEIAKELMTISGAPDEVFFAYSHNYPDALAVSGIAAVTASPILYVGANGVLSAETKAFVEDCGADKATILGGTAAISADAEANIASTGIADVDRIAGDNRYDTNLLINEEYKDVMTGSALCVATGANYPDALAGGVFAAAKKAPMLLVAGSLSAKQKEYTNSVDPDVVYTFGGTAVVPDAIIDEIMA